MNNNRNTIIDIAKGILMILVIIGHFSFFEYEARTITLIYSFHMPAFFIIAGILSHINETNTYKGIIKKRFIYTIIPYYVFYFISFIIIDAKSLGNYNLSLKYMYNGIGNPDFSVNLPLWFLTLYFVATTIYELLDLLAIKISIKIKTNNSSNTNHFISNINEYLLLLFIIILTFISFIYCRMLKGPRLIYNFETALIVLPFIYAGRLFKILYKRYATKIQEIFCIYKNKTIIYRLLNILLFFIILVIWYCLSMKNLRLDLHARNVRHLHLTYINGILGTILLFYATYIISFIPIVNTSLAFLGKISLYILAFHIPGNLITYLVLYDYMPAFITTRLDSFNIVPVIVRTSIELLFSIFMYIICKYVLQAKNKYLTK